jgi:hypothetical protein
VFQPFREEGLKLRLMKHLFGLHEMEYLGYSVYGGKIYVSTKKIKTIKDWPVPITQKELRCFVQLCDSDFKFMRHFSDLSAPLTG